MFHKCFHVLVRKFSVVKFLLSIISFGETRDPASLQHRMQVASAGRFSEIHGISRKSRSFFMHFWIPNFDQIKYTQRFLNYTIRRCSINVFTYLLGKYSRGSFCYPSSHLVRVELRHLSATGRRSTRRADVSRSTRFPENHGDFKCTF